MKVIFLEDVSKVARAGEMKEVADGYGRNFLIPRKLAVLADSSAANVVDAQLKKIARREAQTEAEMMELAKQLEGKGIILKAKTGVNDQLYGSITNADIAEGLSSATSIIIDKKKIELDEHIRQLGSYEITVRLFKDITPKIKLTVVAEEVKEENESKPAKAVKTKTTKAKKAKTEKTVNAEKSVTDIKPVKAVKESVEEVSESVEEVSESVEETPEEKEGAD
ncbi:50S ribosomal protein L9 [Chloroflexota bacterium]